VALTAVMMIGYLSLGRPEPAAVARYAGARQRMFLEPR
jgi:hypothetical protein